MHMTDETNAKIEDEIEIAIAAGLEADRAKRRAELFYAARRKIEAAHYDRINRKAPIEDRYGGLGPEGHAARLKAMEAGSKADREWMDRVNARPVPGSLAATRADQKGGSGGFEIKRGPR
jgi:hypothetical protein